MLQKWWSKATITIKQASNRVKPKWVALEV
jgi:hypothetical protein